MKLSSLEFSFEMNEQSYIKASKINALSKKDLEAQLLNRKRSLLPITFSNSPTYVYYNPDDYNLESDELVNEWVRDLRINDEDRETLMHNVSGHDAFTTLFSLNNLRKAGVPNFLYYHGVVNFNDNFFALSEDVFNKEYKTWPTFTEICKKESFKTILEFYISVLLAIYTANHKFEYTHYGLTCDNIIMKPVENTNFDVEYTFRNKTVYITNKNYIPIITGQEKSYVRLNIDGTDKSFGYNNVDEIPFEFKGIYCDRGFAIADAYTLLNSILEVLKEYNMEAFEKFRELSSFFNGYVNLTDDKFLLYHNGTKDIHLGDYIAYMLLKEETIIKFESKSALLRCSGIQLEIKNNSNEYYTYKNLIQFYDYCRIYNKFVINDSENNLIKKELIKYETLKTALSLRPIIYQFPKNKSLISNKKYIDVMTSNIAELIDYYNNWERLKTSLLIIGTLSRSIEPLQDIALSYNELAVENKVYYKVIISQFIILKNLTRENKDIYNTLIKYVLFLESIE